MHSFLNSRYKSKNQTQTQNPIWNQHLIPTLQFEVWTQITIRIKVYTPKIELKRAFTIWVLMQSVVIKSKLNSNSNSTFRIQFESALKIQVWIQARNRNPIAN